MRDTLKHLPPEACRRCDLKSFSACQTLIAAGPQGTKATHITRFPRNDTILEQGATPEILGVLRRGLALRERQRRDGRRTVLGLAVPGDIICGVPSQPNSFRLSAATDVEVCVFDGALVRRLLEQNPRFRLKLLLETVSRHANQLEMIWRRGALTSRERVAAFLVMASEIMPVEPQPGGGCIVTIELHRQDWADFANTSIESISRVLGALSDAGIVETVGRNRYFISDLDDLMLEAGMDPALDRGGAFGAAAGRRGAAPRADIDLTAINAA